jgi:PAS domain S-box-containing protein
MGSGASNTFPLRRFTQYARLAGTAAVVVGTLVLLGWLLDVGLLKSVLPGKIAMKPITAICFVLLGAALVLLVLAPAQHVVSATRRRAAVVCATLAAATGLATLCEYRFGVDLGIDRLFFRDSLLVKADPGRMAANTALGFVQLGGSLLLLDARHKIGRLYSELLALATLVLGAIALLGYLYGIESLHTLFAYTPIAVHTACLLVLLGLGVLLSHPESGLTSVITSERSGGVMARRIMPVAVFLLIALTWMRLKGGLALFVASSITVLVVWVWLIARSLNSLDARKEQALEALLVSELRYRRLFESAKDGILILDAVSGQIVDVNPFLIEMLGYSKDEFVGKELWEIGVFKDIVASKAAFVELQQQEYIRYEDLPLETRGGLVKQVEFVSNSYLVNGSRVIQCNIRDISDRKQAEEKARESEARYRSLFENMLEGFAHCQMLFENGQPQDLVYLDVNSAFEKLTGLKDVVGKKITDVIPGIRESNPELFEIYGRVALTGKPEKFETYLEALEIWFSISVYSPAKGQFAAVFDNITERKRAEVALEETNHKLETTLDQLSATTQQLWQASKLATMGELAASIAHELNNPLATVALRAEALLMQMPADAEQRKPLEIIAQEVDRMATLVSDLLQFSRRSHRQVSTVDLREEIANSVEFVQYHLRTRKIEVVRGFADQLPTIQADRQQLRQLFLNLLTNASDAMPEGGKLTVRVASSLVDNAEVVAIEFADTGEGIPAENLEKIWDPFFTTKSEGKGTGLGLAICRRICEEHGGTIDIESQVGAGTTVRSVFPATAKGAAAKLL